MARLDSTLGKHYAAVELEDRRRDQFRSLVEDKGAPLTYEPLRFVSFDLTKLKSATASRAESVLARIQEGFDTSKLHHPCSCEERDQH
jgi:hypothetical protein